MAATESENATLPRMPSSLPVHRGTLRPWLGNVFEEPQEQVGAKRRHAPVIDARFGVVIARLRYALDPVVVEILDWLRLSRERRSAW